MPLNRNGSLSGTGNAGDGSVERLGRERLSVPPKPENLKFAAEHPGGHSTRIQRLSLLIIRSPFMQHLPAALAVGAPPNRNRFFTAFLDASKEGMLTTDIYYIFLYSNIYHFLLSYIIYFINFLLTNA
jgi:hypothetical protein